MKPLTRRSVTTGLAAAVTVIPAAMLTAAPQGKTTIDLMREFIQKLLTERDGITVGEWIHRKTIARGLQALIGDDGEPWTPYEAELVAENERNRQGPIWRAG